MTLRELQKHINATIDANDKAGNQRNAMRVCVQMKRDTKRYRLRHFEVDLFYRGQLDIGSNHYGAYIHVYECAEIKP